MFFSFHSVFPSHTGAVLASLCLFIMLVLAVVVYSKCLLNFKLWYKNSYGDYEMNGKTALSFFQAKEDISCTICSMSLIMIHQFVSHSDGKIYDAFISYINDENDQKFVNFILKPHLETKYGHKLLLNNTDILPGSGISLGHVITE